MSEKEKNFEQHGDQENCDCKQKCDCEPECECEPNCECQPECDCQPECNCEKNCDCNENCDCGDNCQCSDDCGCDCGDDCRCGKQCTCEGCSCGSGNDGQQGGQKSDLAEQYLNLARQIQADFENYRRHAIEDIKDARVNGQKSVIDVFLPCLDTFKDAKKSITDQNILSGVNMIEDKILQALQSLGVQKMSTIGESYDPHMHECIMAVKDESQENNIILDEYQAGYTFNGKVIRYPKVIVNKKED